MWWRLHHALANLSPHRCASCDEKELETVLCPTCSARAHYWPRNLCAVCASFTKQDHRTRCLVCAESIFGSLSGVHVSWQYRDAIKELILSAKLGSRLDRSILMGGLALENPPHNAIISRCDCVVPVPPSRARLLRVGYDTSTEFAAFIAKAIDRPLFAPALRR